MEEIQGMLDKSAKHPPKVKATLVVVPVILVTQWKTELQRHASLKVVVMQPGVC